MRDEYQHDTVTMTLIWKRCCVNAECTYTKVRWIPPPTGISWPRMTISDFYCYSSYRKINWQTYPLATDISWPGMVISDFYCYSSYRKINWQIYPPKVQVYTGQEWQFQISIFSYRQIYPPKTYN